MSGKKITSTILFLTTILSACLYANNENNLVRRAVLGEVLSIESAQFDDLVIWLEEGEARENFGFQGTTVYLIRPVREKEYWAVRDPARSYIFIGDIIYNADQTRATSSVEIYLRENDRRQFEYFLQKLEDVWKVISQREI